jgi:hypothetical protein
MTPTQFVAALGAFSRRRPFQVFSIEFTSGNLMPVRHPEAVRQAGELYVWRGADAAYALFAAESVSRLLDVPTSIAN